MILKQYVGRLRKQFYGLPLGSHTVQECVCFGTAHGAAIEVNGRPKTQVKVHSKCVPRVNCVNVSGTSAGELLSDLTRSSL